MARIFGAFLRGPVDEGGQANLDALDRMMSQPSTGDGLMRVHTGSSDGTAAAGLASGPETLTGGVSQTGHGRYIIAFYGQMPRLDEALSSRGIDSKGDPGAGIIELYRREGEGFLEHLPGMFALVLYDGEKRLLLAAGDRNGYCPVYYAETLEGVFFSSTLAPLAAMIDPLGLDRGSAIEYLMFDTVYGDRTFYSGIDMIPYGGCVTLASPEARVRRGRYFAYESLFDISGYSANARIDAPAELTRRMAGSLSRALEGRDPRRTGLLCGGGVDCSYLGGLLRSEGRELPIFCATVEGGKVSEGEMARATSERLGSDIHVGVLSRRLYYPLLLRSILDFGQPIAHPNLARFYVNARTAAGAGRPEQVLGVASDLLFGGQGNVRSLYRYLTVSKYMRWLPEKASRVLSHALGESTGTDLALRLRNSLELLGEAGMGNFDRAAVRRNITEALAGIGGERERRVKTLMVENLCDYQQHLLNRRYEMASRCGMELLFPFLDEEVVRLAINLPVGHCVDWKSSKKVVRRAALPYLGSDLASRAKWGGDVPTAEWIAPLRHLLDGGFVEDQLGFDSRSLSPLLDGHVKFLWNMLDLELWGRLCLYGHKPESVLEEIRKNGLECDTFESVL